MVPTTACILPPDHRILISAPAPGLACMLATAALPHGPEPNRHRNWTYGVGTAGDHFVVGVTSTANPSGTGLTTAELAQIQFADFHTGASIATHTTATRSIGEILPTVGDINQDGIVNAADVSALMSGLTNISAFQAARTATSPSGVFTASDAKFLLDVNGDGVDTNTDVQAEISLIATIAAGGTGVTNPVPEPAASCCWHWVD